MSADLDVVELAERAREAVRAINHLTIVDGDPRGYTNAGDVSAVLVELAGLADGLGQALGQAGGWLGRATRAGTVRHDAVLDPTASRVAAREAVEEVGGTLAVAAAWLAAAGRLTRDAAGQASHLGGFDNDSNEDDEGAGGRGAGGGDGGQG